MRNLDFEARVVCAIAESCPDRIVKGSTALPALEAMRAELVTSCLLKMAMFSLGIQSMAEMGQPGGAGTPLQSLEAVPASLLGLSVSYALDAAPRNGEGLIEVFGLVDHVDELELTFGRIIIDSALVEEIRRVAATPRPTAGIAEGAQ